MAGYTKLIREARNLTASRGHKLGEFLLTRIQTGNPPVSTRGAMVAVCEYCGASAAVDSDPPAGASEVWGEALESDCPGKVLADYQESETGGEATMQDDDLLTSLQAKLDPRRFPNMSPQFAAVVGCLLKIRITEPHLVQVVVTSDGFLLGRNEGEPTCQHFLGTREWLEENWEKLISLPDVALTGDEYQAARGLITHLEKEERIYNG